jgi:hypothetical protein
MYAYPHSAEDILGAAQRLVELRNRFIAAVIRKNGISCDQAARGHDSDRFKTLRADLTPHASRLTRPRRQRTGTTERTSALAAGPASTARTRSPCRDGRFSGGLLSTFLINSVRLSDSTPDIPSALPTLTMALR